MMYPRLECFPSLGKQPSNISDGAYKPHSCSFLSEPAAKIGFCPTLCFSMCSATSTNESHNRKTMSGTAPNILQSAHSTKSNKRIQKRLSLGHLTVNLSFFSVLLGFRENNCSKPLSHAATWPRLTRLASRSGPGSGFCTVVVITASSRSVGGQ